MPDSYVPIRTPARKLMATPTPYGGATPGFYAMPDEDRGQGFDVPDTPADLPTMKPEDYQYFAPLLKETGGGGAVARGAEGAQNHETPVEGEERCAAATQERAASADGQGAGVRRGPAV